MTNRISPLTSAQTCNIVSKNVTNNQWETARHVRPRAGGRLDYDCIGVYYKVIHPDSRVDLGSSHHLMHNGEGIKLVSPKVDEKSMCEGNAYV